MEVYEYDLTDTATDDVNCAWLEDEINASEIAGSVQYVLKENGLIKIHFESALSSGDETILDGLVAAHQHITTAAQLKKYLDGSVFPFIDDLITTFAAENIALGITQAGKTADVLGLFEKQYDVGAAHDISLKGCFDTGSLYEALTVLQHVRDNTGEYSGMSPYVTDARLLKMKNDIETFLGVELSE